MIPTDYYEMNATGRKNVLGKFSLSDLVEAKKSETSISVIRRIDARISTLNSVAARKREKETLKRQAIDLMEQGFSKEQCRIRLRTSPAIINQAIIDHDYEYELRRSIDEVIPEKTRKDRLHYHKWDSSLVIDKELFETIDEEWY